MRKIAPGATLFLFWMCGVLHCPAKIPKSVGMHNGHEWMQDIRQDDFVHVTCQSRILICLEFHITPTAHAPYHHRATRA
ncbi:hypothetical protein TNCV_3858911 [Trichonephila clavipes]|nr:hypothetical protein TNCV_3858911 [Trichonephila clavipes]